MHDRLGFSLVELSIVLVILGLLTGGILAGQSLIRASELRAISSEYSRYIAARNSFRDKYFSLPGDMANAFAFWGATCGTNTTTASTGCNGDGDGRVEALTLGENIKVWEHLSRAGLIEGSFDGTGTDSGGYLDVTSANVPRSKFPQGAWDMTDLSGNCQGNNCNNVLSFGMAGGAGSNSLQLIPGFTLGEAWNIDTKMDDGRANTGSVRGDGGDSCYDTGTDYYSIQASGEKYGNCMLHFPFD